MRGLALAAMVTVAGGLGLAWLLKRTVDLAVAISLEESDDCQELVALLRAEHAGTWE